MPEGHVLPRLARPLTAEFRGPALPVPSPPGRF
ncbi:MAG: Fpg/Nei family DNA glycosylase, partial [Corynebacterium flavescens]|nr:Fpg/Nei family DNA glycosylase [Corynebacterium flavescens]